MKRRELGTPTDTGPLLALLNQNDASHARCTAALSRLRAPMLPTVPCLTETLHFLGRAGGWAAQEVVWQLVADGDLRLHFLDETQLMRARQIMETFADAPCDFADASLVVMAETLGLTRVFTLDSHFYAYRLSDGSAMEVIPGSSR